MKNSDKNSDQVFLAKWLNHELSDDDLKKLVSMADFNFYVKVRDGLTYFKAPEFEADKTLLRIKDILPKKNTKKITLKPYLYYASAATIALLFSIYFYTNSVTANFQTNFSEQKTIVLKDGSQVNLNAKSTLTYHKKFWNKKREVQLDGEAFFKVTKGTGFEVQTDYGTVTVLGTKFNVNSQVNFFSVMCYEGKVMVIQQKDTTYLTQGTAYQNSHNFIEKYNFSTEQPSWQDGETTFKSTPLKIVMVSMQKQFGIEFIYENIDDTKLFTGTYYNTDLETALKTVFIPMQLDFHIENKKVFLSKK